MPSIRRLRPSIYTFDLGRFRIATLLDFAEVRNGLGVSFAVGQPEAVLRELAALNHIAPLCSATHPHGLDHDPL